MRENKYRAWDKDKHEMLSWEQLQVNSVGFVHSLIGEGNWIAMQYTGLHDKNGKEIYEGDIVKCVEMHDGNVFGRAWKSVDGYSVAQPMVIKKDQNGIDWEWFDDIRYSPEYWEVIGNLYENPDILKETL